ncbi:MAG: iron transporter [Flavobacteriales bacterium]|nr:iron transporter [Flavobacteriales bacterium]
MLNKNFFKTLGPGILFASTAIGVSHLVQSTRAGAEYGFALVGFVFLANIFKYPFFEFGSRYANVTGKTLLEGYQKKGNWILWIYLIITFLSMFIVVAAVSFVCSGLISELVDNQFNINKILFFLFFLCVVILINGKFNILDSLVKVIAVVLLISTFLAFIFTLINGPELRVHGFIKPEIFNDKGILFVIALMGWMPTAVDMSVWNSIWTIKRMEQTNYKPKLQETLLDFNIGYIITIILSIFFITMGAYLMFGTGEKLPDSSSLFANKLISLYTSSLGIWSYWIIAVSAFSVMFSTTLSVIDGYSSTIQKTIKLLFNLNSTFFIYKISLLVIVFGSYIITWKFIDNFKQLIDLATTISFLIAPFCAIANHIVVHSDDIPINKRPPFWLKILSFMGIIFLILFSLIYLFYLIK